VRESEGAYYFNIINSISDSKKSLNLLFY